MPTDNRKKIPPLFAVPEREAADEPHTPEEKPARRRKAESPVCRLCFGTGLEVVPGKGARRCEFRTQESREKLIAAARFTRRYQHCTLKIFLNWQLYGFI